MLTIHRDNLLPGWDLNGSHERGRRSGPLTQGRTAKAGAMIGR